MLTWIVEPKDVDVNFTLKELMDFSRLNKARVIVRGILEFKKGVVAWMK